MEVFPNIGYKSIGRTSLLHVRGGVSNRPFTIFILTLSSPRPWRCFCESGCTDVQYGVFSTSVEVFLKLITSSRYSSSLLHVRGGVSAHAHDSRTRTQSSPRPWRCFLHGPRVYRRQHVFSTSVEVFPKHRGTIGTHTSLLHVRGGVSTESQLRTKTFASSPRPWRCFRHILHAGEIANVFSTSVEVFLEEEGYRAARAGLLHVRGGVSPAKQFVELPRTSSPRPWRCFLARFCSSWRTGVFSTSVEVFRKAPPPPPPLH